MISAVDHEARAAGLSHGMTLARARAIRPDCRFAEGLPEPDERTLTQLAEWALWLSPLVAADPPDGLLIDTAGCAHLFGGEAAMLSGMHKRLALRGHVSRLAIADRGQDIERAQIYAKRLCAHLWVDSMRRRLQHSKGIHRTVVASPLVAEPAYRQRRDSVVRHLRKYCLGNTFQHEAVSIRDMAKDFG